MLYTDLYFSSDYLSNSQNIKCNNSILKLLQIFDHKKIYTTKNVCSYILCQTDIGHSIYLIHVSKVDQSIHGISEYFVNGLAILCMSNVGQSIHGIRGYFAKEVSMGWPRYVCPTLVRISMESADTLCQGGIHGLATLCMSNVGQSIHGIRGYFAKGVSIVGHTLYVQHW